MKYKTQNEIQMNKLQGIYLVVVIIIWITGFTRLGFASCVEWSDAEIETFKQIEKSHITIGLNNRTIQTAYPEPTFPYFGNNYSCEIMRPLLPMDEELFKNQTEQENCAHVGGLFFEVTSKTSKDFQQALQANPNRCSADWEMKACCFMTEPSKCNDRYQAIRGSFGMCLSRAKTFSDYSVKFEKQGNFFRESLYCSTNTDQDLKDFFKEAASNPFMQKITGYYKALVTDFAAKAFVYELQSLNRSLPRSLVEKKIACAAQCITHNLLDYQRRSQTGLSHICAERAVLYGKGECGEFAKTGEQIMRSAGLNVRAIAHGPGLKKEGHALVGITFSDGMSFALDTVAGDCKFIPWLFK
ncbi:MAG: hypothetical protein HY843_09045 [Bdellovibrio sp.]|nr:hypothetical protein [Bdellovibrio sp.]